MTYTEDFDGAIGIDLGTTYSCVAVLENDRVEIIANEQGNRTTPSYVAFTDEGERLVGDAAKNQGTMNPRRTVFDAKRLIGRRFDDPAVKKDMAHWPFEVVDRDGTPFVCVRDAGAEKVREFTAQEISAMVLGKMKEIAEQKLGKRVTKAVVTVPAYFNDAQRQATKDAGAISGLEVLRIINEPTAAAIAYGLGGASASGDDSGAAAPSSDDKERNVLIYDLGGGTFDVSLLSIHGGIFTVRATAGDTHLGGEDFDNTLVQFFADDFKKRHKRDLTTDARALRRLRTAAERAKRALSSVTQTTVEIDALFDGIDYTCPITRARFESLNQKAFEGTLDPVRQVLRDAKMDKKDVDEIVLVGGSTRIPRLQTLLQEYFDGKELNKSINPDEAVAYGAAVQAAVLTGHGTKKTQDLLLLDVVPLSLGIEMQGGVMAVVVPRNTPIPTLKKKIFTTVDDNQTQVTFPVYEGERPMCKDNNLLGEFELQNIPPAPRGTPELECTFEINADGLLKVTAQDKATGRTADITISNSSGRLSAADIDRMVADAERNKKADEERRLRVAALQDYENFLYQVETSMQECTTMKRNDRADIEEQLSRAMDWLNLHGESASEHDISLHRKKLQKTVSPVFAKAYGNKAGK